MDEIFEKTLLFDFYGELLTDKQKKIYELYHLDDLSLGEISEQMQISRQGVFDALKRCHNQLNHYEDKLHLVKHFVDNKSRVGEIHQLVLQLQEEKTLPDDLRTRYIEPIDGIAREILKDL